MSACAVLPPGLHKIPPFPAVAAKLMVLLSNPMAEFSEVAELIASDPTLTAQVLKAVNSYDYALKSPVTNIRQAVALVGLSKIRQIATAAATQTYIKRLMTAELLRCWHHSVATAVLCDEIAHACGAFTNIAFVAGIMHDLGRLGLLVGYPAEYSRIMLDAENSSLDLLEIEEQKFGINHAEVGRLLGEMWELPEEFRLIMGRHHDPCDGQELDLLRIVHVGCRLADSLGFGAIARPAPAPGDVLTELPGSAIVNMQQTPEQLSALIEKRISSVT